MLYVQLLTKASRIWINKQNKHFGTIISEMTDYTNQNNLCQVLNIQLFSLNEFVNNITTKQTRMWTAYLPQHL